MICKNKNPFFLLSQRAKYAIDFKLQLSDQFWFSKSYQNDLLSGQI